MSNLLFSQKYSEVISASQDFVAFSVEFIHFWKHDLINRLASTPLFRLAPTIPTLTYRLKEMAFLEKMPSNKEQHELLQALQLQMEELLYDLEVNIELISAYLPNAESSMLHELEIMWKLFDRVYKELRDVVKLQNYYFDFDEKLEKLHD